MLEAALQVFSDKGFGGATTRAIATGASPRHDWVVENFGRPIWTLLRPLFEALHGAGLLSGAPPRLAYFSLIGSALITFGNPMLIASFSDGAKADANWVVAATNHMLRPIFEQA